jgi:hypothetical protein
MGRGFVPGPNETRERDLPGRLGLDDRATAADVGSSWPDPAGSTWHHPLCSLTLVPRRRDPSGVPPGRPSLLNVIVDSS